MFLERCAAMLNMKGRERRVRNEPVHFPFSKLSSKYHCSLRYGRGHRAVMCSRLIQITDKPNSGSLDDRRALKRMVDSEVVDANSDRYCIHPRILAVMADSKASLLVGL